MLDWSYHLEEEKLASIVTVMSFRPAMPPLSPLTFLSFQLTISSETPVDRSAFWIALESASWKSPLADFPSKILNVISFHLLSCLNQHVHNSRIASVAHAQDNPRADGVRSAADRKYSKFADEIQPEIPAFNQIGWPDYQY